MSVHPNKPGGLIVSVDVEDWLQSKWDRSREVRPRAADNTLFLLDLLAAHGKKVTMFILGKFAERFPDVVKRIAAGDHEVASHGYGHIEVFRQTPLQFRADVVRAKEFLQDLLGQPVLGYRAPVFSITRANLWALDILAEAGFAYDSSIFPIRHQRFGIESWPLEPVRVRLSSGCSLVEIPLAAVEIAGRRWPVAGGGYHRLLPWPVIQRAIAGRLLRGQTFMAYCHPYEMDLSDLDDLPVAVPLSTRLHQGLGRGSIRRKFERTITTFDVVQARLVAGSADLPHYNLMQSVSL
jgi:polysaccharide deacetylase family protein (PEP-CTERM system associated)